VSNDATLRSCDGKEKGAVIVVIAGTYLQYELPVEILGFFLAAKQVNTNAAKTKFCSNAGEHLLSRPIVAQIRSSHFYFVL
jgi:hypothetical protein